MNETAQKGARRLARIAALVCAPLSGPGPELFSEEVEYSATGYELLFAADELSSQLPSQEHFCQPTNRRGFCSWRARPVNLPDLRSLDRLAVTTGLSVCPAETFVVKRAYRRNHARYAFVLLSGSHAHVFVLRFLGAAVEALLKR